MGLLNILKSKGNILQNSEIVRLETIINEATKKLSTVCLYFPHFSKHDITHSKTIENQICNLLGEERLLSLTCSDITFLMLSFYLHDVGMALEYEDINNKFKSAEFQNYIEDNALNDNSSVNKECKLLKNMISNSIVLNYENSIDVYNAITVIIEDVFRENHAFNSADYILNNELIKQTLGIRCQKLLSEICLLHQKPTSEILKLPYKCNGLYGDFIHPRMIASLLCLGDLLDLDTDRFDDYITKASTPFPYMSKVHMKKHESITHFLVDINVIEVCSDTDNIEVYRTMRQWMAWMKATCEFIALNWNDISPDDFGNAPAIKKCELLLNGNSKWVQYSDFKYKLSSERFFEIMKGSNIYRNKFICIREIIQNSIDATLLRLFDENIIGDALDEMLEFLSDEKLHKKYKITGRISSITDEQGENKIQVEIKDSGIGIAEEEIVKIGKVSNCISERKKNILKKMPECLKPSGAFGLGLQSIFLLADSFEIITKTKNEPPKKIVFNSHKTGGYIIIDDYREEFEQGTTLRFTIDNTKFTCEEISCPLYYFKLNDISRFIGRKICLFYDNSDDRLRNSAPIYQIEREKEDFLPVEIEFDNIFKLGENSSLKYDPIFKNYNEMKIENGVINVKKFIRECNSVFYFYMRLKDISENKKQKNYGVLHDNVDTGMVYGNAIFYKNKFVSSNEFPSHYYCNMPIFPYIDWKLNVLDSSADEVLTLSRNSIRKSYLEIIYQKVCKCVEETIRSIIDEIIDNVDYNFVKDTIVLLLQFSKQYDYRFNELVKKYTSSISDIIIGNYYLYGSKNEVEVNLTKLLEIKIYFVLESYGKIKLGIKNEMKIPETELYSIEKTTHVHLFNHKLEKVFLYKHKGEILKVAECSPLNYNKLTEDLFEFDKYVLLEQAIHMIVFSTRGIMSFKKYQILGTKVCNDFSSYIHNMWSCADYIELPFEPYIGEMQESLLKQYYLENAVEKYFNNILNSELYSTNLKYILQSNNSEKRDIITANYNSLIKDILMLLEDKDNECFINAVIEKIKDRRVNNRIDHSAYLTFFYNLL